MCAVCLGVCALCDVSCAVCPCASYVSNACAYNIYSTNQYLKVLCFVFVLLGISRRCWVCIWQQQERACVMYGVFCVSSVHHVCMCNGLPWHIHRYASSTYNTLLPSQCPCWFLFLPAAAAAVESCNKLSMCVALWSQPTTYYCTMRGIEIIRLHRERTKGIVTRTQRCVDNAKNCESEQQSKTWGVSGQRTFASRDRQSFYLDRPWLMAPNY